MDEAKKRMGLGRGLSALFGDAMAEPEEAQGERVRLTRLIPVDQLRAGIFQPRRHFDEEDLRSLVDSVRERGILQPLLVRRIEGAGPGDPPYEIIAGERRWRAAQMAGLSEVPVLVRTLSDSEALEVALVENIQRADLTPLEEAEGFDRLIREFAHSQEDLARAVGKSRSHVANMLRLLALPDPVKKLVQDRLLTMGHARALLMAADPSALALEVVRLGLNVRQTEALVKAPPPPSDGAPPPPAKVKSPDTVALEKEISTALGVKVKVSATGHKGVLQIHYRNLDQLDGVLGRILGRR